MFMWNVKQQRSCKQNVFFGYRFCCDEE